MQPQRILSFIPRLPPRVDGVGDYGLVLAKVLKHRHNVDTIFIVLDPLWNGPSIIEGFPVQKIDRRDPASLIKLVGHLLSADTAILVHYVGYGYAKRGCPVWLIQGLALLKKNFSFKLITMFHELSAMGPVWTSQFWLSPLQKYLVHKLSSLSDKKHTSLSLYKMQINAQVSHPVLSNVGEPIAVKPLSHRKKQMVIFGSPGPRSRVYQFSKENLQKICRVLDISRIIDVGSPLSVTLPRLDGVEIISKGILQKEEISELLNDSMVGFFNYPSTYLSKSGIFAAYCAHGVLPIGHFYPGQESLEAKAGNIFAFAEQMNSGFTLTEAQNIASCAFTWYQEHRSEVHADLFFQSLQ